MLFLGVLAGAIVLLVGGLVAMILVPVFRTTAALERRTAAVKARGIEVPARVLSVERARGVVYASQEGEPYFIHLEITLPEGRRHQARAYLVGHPPAIAPYQVGAGVRAWVDPDAPDLVAVAGVAPPSAGRDPEP